MPRHRASHPPHLGNPTRSFLFPRFPCASLIGFSAVRPGGWTAVRRDGSPGFGSVDAARPGTHDVGKTPRRSLPQGEGRKDVARTLAFQADGVVAVADDCRNLFRRAWSWLAYTSREEGMFESLSEMRPSKVYSLAVRMSTRCRVGANELKNGLEG